VAITLLCIGDIVGNPGRQVVETLLPDVVSTYQVDVVIANVENAAGGFGVTAAIYRQFKAMGISVMTTGNHVYDKREIMGQMDGLPDLIRPLNFPGQHPGRGWVVTPKGGVNIAVVNVIGRVFMAPSDCPFQTMATALDTIRAITPVIVVDFHAEATSEKQAMGHYLAQKVSLVYGTHTHVMTADETILAGHTAYITDIGMTGAKDGILGMEKGPIIQRFFDQRPVSFTPAKSNQNMLNAVAVTVDEQSGQALEIRRIAVTI